MTWIECGPQHLEAIRGIFNEAIVNSTALYDYQPRSLETMQAWFAAKQKGCLPVIGVVNDQDELMGFASYEALLTELDTHREIVGKHFERRS